MKLERPSVHTRLRLGLTVIIAFMMVSSTATVILFDPGQVLAYSRVNEDSNSHSNPPMSQERSSPSVSSPSSSQSNESAPAPTAPSTISQDGGGDVTIQAPLTIPRTLQSNDLVNSLAFYEVTFITSTTGVIDKIEMVFPAGTVVAAAGLIERVGIGGGTLLKSGSTITFDLTTPVSIPAGTFIRLEMFGIKNPINPSTTFTAMITTRDSGGVPIDGPSQTNVYTIKKIGSSDLADGSVTFTKPAESFMKRVTLEDNDAGHAAGWDPNGATNSFTIQGSTLSTFPDRNFVNVIVTGPVGSAQEGFACFPTGYAMGGTAFVIVCNGLIPDGFELHYVIEQLPEHIGDP